MVKKVRKVSPFEVHVNRDKSKVLGRKIKADHGLPGVSRSKAIRKRKNTLLVEYKNRDKNNVFLDKRIGERNQNLTPEERTLARFTAEKLKSYGNKNMSNMNEDEILTFKGQSLMDVEKYDDLRISDNDSEDGDERSGLLDKKFIEENHFGGGMLSKATSRKDIIQQIIINDKIRKAEKQKEKEEKINLTEKIDSEWHDLLPLISFGNKDDTNKTEEAEVTEKTTKSQEKGDSYDVTMRALKFEARLPATDKLRPVEEIEREEKAALEKYEKERLERMHGFTDADTEYLKQHKSADDLDDYKIEEIVDEGSDVEDEKIMTFADMIEHMRKKKAKEEKNGEEDTSDDEIEESDAGEDDESDAEQDNESDAEQDDENDDVEESDAQSINGTDDAKEHVSENSEEDADEDEQESDTENSKVEEDEQDSDDENNVNTKKHEKMSNNESDKDDSSSKEESESESEDNLSDLREETSDEESEEEETPKQTVQEKKGLEKPISSKTECLIQKDIESIISDHYKNKKKDKNSSLELFSTLLEHLENQFAFGNDPTKERFFKTFDRMCPHMYDLAHANPSETRNVILTYIRKKHDEFENKSKIYPGLNTIILFKLISLLYPTSDFRHHVVTPSIVFMSQILLKCKVKSKLDVAKGLFIVALILEYTALSGRWDPAAINYLRGILFVSLPKPLTKVPTVVPPFKNTSVLGNILVLEKNQSKTKLSELSAEDIKMKAKDFSDTEMDDDFRIRAFCTSINLLHAFESQLNKFDAAFSIFEPHLAILKSCSTKWYPKIVQENVKALIAKFEQLKEKRIDYLTFEKKKPKPLKQLEASIMDTIYDDKRKNKGLSQEKQEEKKLIHKLKREKRGAVREIRRDTAYTTKIRIKEEIASNMESKRKYNKFRAELAEEAHESKKFRKT
ncbi:hypothetical protein TKK_0010646 [Trichogramma kaykai]